MNEDCEEEQKGREVKKREKLVNPVNAVKPSDMSELLNQRATRIPLSVIFP